MRSWKQLQAVRAKYSPELRAAAELELRRRQKLRAADCAMCDLEEAVNEIYETGEGRPIECTHRSDEQVRDSPFWQEFESRVETVYGEKSNEVLSLEP